MQYIVFYVFDRSSSPRRCRGSGGVVARFDARALRSYRENVQKRLTHCSERHSVCWSGGSTGRFCSERLGQFSGVCFESLCISPPRGSPPRSLRKLERGSQQAAQEASPRLGGDPRRSSRFWTCVTELSAFRINAYCRITHVEAQLQIEQASHGFEPPCELTRFGRAYHTAL